MSYFQEVKGERTEVEQDTADDCELDGLLGFDLAGLFVRCSCQYSGFGMMVERYQIWCLRDFNGQACVERTERY